MAQLNLFNPNLYMHDQLNVACMICAEACVDRHGRQRTRTGFCSHCEGLHVVFVELLGIWMSWCHNQKRYVPLEFKLTADGFVHRLCNHCAHPHRRPYVLGVLPQPYNDMIVLPEDAMFYHRYVQKHLNLNEFRPGWMPGGQAQLAAGAVQAQLLAQPVEAQPEEAQLLAQPVEAQPEEAQLLAQPVEAQPEEAQLLAQPVEAQPEEAQLLAQPVEAQPEEAQLLAQPVEAQPEEQAQEEEEIGPGEQIEIIGEELLQICPGEQIEIIGEELVQIEGQECRMYENRLPRAGTVVMTRIEDVIEGQLLSVRLLEYNRSGLVNLRLTRRTTDNILTVGNILPLTVAEVDEENITLATTAPKKGALACEKNFEKSNLVHSIMHHVAETLKINLEDLYVDIAWPLYRIYGHAFEAFKVAMNDPDPDSVLSSLTREVKETGPDGQEVTKVVPAVTQAIKDALINGIRRHMTPQPMKIRADIGMKCFQSDDVLHIKEAEAAGNDDCPTQTLDKVSERDEIGGDDDSEDEEGTGMGEIDVDAPTGITE